MKQAKSKDHNSQTEIHSLRMAFSWGPALLQWHPTEQARQALAREIVARTIEDEEFKEACSFFHRGVEYSLLDDRPSGFINETIATVTNFFWCEIEMSNVQALFGD